MEHVFICRLIDFDTTLNWPMKQFHGTRIYLQINRYGGYAFERSESEV